MNFTEKRKSLRVQLHNAKMDLLFQMKKIGRASEDCAFKALADVEDMIWEESPRDSKGFFISKPKLLFYDPSWDDKFLSRLRMGLNDKFLLNEEEKAHLLDLVNCFDSIDFFLKEEVQELESHQRLLRATYDMMRGWIFKKTGERNIVF